MTMTRPFPGVLNLSTPAHRATVVVASGTAAFWLVAFAFTYVTTQLRFDALAAAKPRMQAAYERWDAGTSAALTWGSVDAPASEQLGPIMGHVTALSITVALVLTVMAVLVVHRRFAFAVIAGASASLGVALGAGPLALMAGTIEQASVSVNGLQVANPDATAAERAFVEYQNTMIAFAAPDWWYAAVGAGVAVLIGAVLVALLRFAAPSEHLNRVPAVVSTGVIAVFLVVAGLAGMNDIVTDEDEIYSGLQLTALLVTYLGIGVAAAVAGAALAEGRRSFLPALALTGFVALTMYVTWSAHHVTGGADKAFGYVDLGSDPPPISTPMFAAALLAAVPFGWGTAMLASAAANSRAAHGGAIAPTT